MKPPAAPPEFVLPLLPQNAPVNRCSVSREAASRRILIMRLGAHGDILMGTPLLTALRAAWPDAHLTWIVERKERDSIDAHPLIDEILLWDGAYWKRMLRRGLFPLWLARGLRFRRALRERRYDVFISFQPEEWPLLTRAVNAPMSVGVFDTFRQFQGAQGRSPHTRLYSTAFTEPDLPPHRTDQYLLPLRALGLPEPADKRMSLGYTSEDAQAAAQVLGATERFAVLAPMTTWPSRCWPAERYAELGDALARTHGCRIVLIGSAKERPQVEAIAAQMKTPPLVAAGALRFREMAALIARACLLVSGDTGPMHVAAALGVPYIALFGPTPVEGRAPLAGRGLSLLHPVPCGPCDQKVCRHVDENERLCLRRISVEEVLAAARSL